MKTITARNVNDAFPIGILFLNKEGVYRNSRNGQVLELDTPLSIEYLNPLERVLFDRKRAVNPFLHFFEPLWILAGRNDVSFLATIVARFKEYSDNGDTFYGAYGWRLHQFDQIKEAISSLKENKDDRRVVLMLRHPEDIHYSGKDQPCNLAITCKVRDDKLNIVVYNRSNDYIWGMTGANMPQFSVLQEYLAGMIGVDVGTYHQITDSAHVYVENPQWELLKDTPLFVFDPYSDTNVLVKPYSLFTGIENRKHLFDEDLKEFFFAYDNPEQKAPSFGSLFFSDVVWPMWRVFLAHKSTKSGLRFVDEVAAADWRAYTKQWLLDKENKQ